MPSSLQILVTNSFLGREDISSYLQMPRTVRTARERPAAVVHAGGARWQRSLVGPWTPLLPRPPTPTWYDSLMRQEGNISDRPGLQRGWGSLCGLHPMRVLV